MQANHFERLPPSIGDGSITGIGNENGRAVSRKQGKELQPRLDRGRRGEETAEVLRADGPQISQPPAAKIRKLLVGKDRTWTVHVQHEAAPFQLKRRAHPRTAAPIADRPEPRAQPTPLMQIGSCPACPLFSDMALTAPRSRERTLTSAQL